MEFHTVIQLEDNRQVRFTKLECDDFEKKITVYYRIEKLTSTGFFVEEYKHYDLVHDKFDYWNSTELGQAVRVALESGITKDLTDNNIR